MDRSALRFGLAAIALAGASLGAPAAATAAPGALEFQEQHTDTGLAFARGVTVSPDGANVYVAGQNADAVVAYSRAASGALTSLGCVEDTGAPSATACASSGDGLNSARFIAVFGSDVYVTGGDDDAVAIFSRAGNGALTPDGCVESTGGASATCADLVTGTNVLDGAEGIAVSPDGNQVYVAGQDASRLVTLNRNPGTGALTFATSTTTNLANPRELAISPDGRGVYVASASGNAIAAFLRDTGNGTLSGLREPPGASAFPWASPSPPTASTSTPARSTAGRSGRTPATPPRAC